MTIKTMKLDPERPQKEPMVVAKVAGIRVRFQIWANLDDFELKLYMFN